MGVAFRAWLGEESYSHRTRTVYEQYAQRAQKYLEEQRGVSLGRAKTCDLREWWATLPPSSSSRNVARHALIAWYRSKGRSDGGPARALPRIPAPQGLPRPMAEEIYRLFLRTAHNLGGPHELTGALLGYTGCRIGEAATAKWSQFELTGDEPVWYVAGKGSRRRGPKVRVVPLVPELAAVLLAWRGRCGDPEWVFPSTRSATGHLHNATLRQYVSEIAEAAAADRVNPHRWRHSVATIILEETNDLRALADLLGHTSLATTQIYTKVTQRRVRRCVSVLSPTADEPTAA